MNGKQRTPVWTAVLCFGVATALLGGDANVDPVQCANLTYAGSKSSQCFSSQFMKEVEKETNIRIEQDFEEVRLDSDRIYDVPFAIMTGEGSFQLYEQEKINLRDYLDRGGFVLASAGCSSSDWDHAFRKEINSLYPDKELEEIPMDHPIYRTVHRISRIHLKSGGTALLEGLIIDGRIALIYSSEGLNDTSNVQGCCCCGGNEVRNSKEINTNILAYALTH